MRTKQGILGILVTLIILFTLSQGSVARAATGFNGQTYNVAPDIDWNDVVWTLQVGYANATTVNTMNFDIPNIYWNLQEFDGTGLNYFGLIASAQGSEDTYRSQVLYDPTSGFEKPVMELIFETPRDINGVTDAVIEINYPDSSGTGYLRFTISKDELYVTGKDNDGASPFLDRVTGDPLYTDGSGNALYYDSVPIDATFWDTTTHTFRLGIRDTHYIDFWIDGLKKNTIYNPNLYNPSIGANILTDRAFIAVYSPTLNELIWFNSYDLSEGYEYVNSVPVLDAISNVAINEGDSTSLNVAYSDGDSWDTFTSTIDWGDSSTSDGVVVFTANGDPTTGGTGTITSSHTYADDGIYTVTVTVTDVEGGSDTSTYQVTVNELPPDVVVNWVPTLHNGHLDVDFDITIDASPDTVASISWAFGDTTTDTTEDPDHEYPAHAVYTVTLTVTDDDGSEFTSTFDVVADVAVLDLTQSGPEDQGVPVSFGATYNYPSHTTQTIIWDFGDGNSDTTNTLTPTHTYVNDGTYTVTCTIVAENSRETVETVSVTILNASPPDVVINWVPTLVDGRLNVDFDIDVDASPDTVASISWAFGDTTTDTAEDPDHYYPAHAVYSVTLTVTDSQGSVFTSTFDVVADVAVLDLTQSGPEDQGVAVSFGATYNYPSHSAQTITWDFGDGNSDTTNTLTPSHAYVNDGTYTVTCTIVAENSRETVETISVIIKNASAPEVIINWTPTLVDGRLNVDFQIDIDPTPDTVASISWAFGDTTTGTAEDPDHYYPAHAVYTVTLSVTDSEGSVFTSIFDVVADVAVLDLTQSGPEDQGVAVSFGATYNYPTHTAQTITWDFGDGNSDTSNTLTPIHAYVNDGAYTVTCTIVAENSRETVEAVSVIINNASPPIVDINWVPTLVDGRLNVDFDITIDASPDTVASISWAFGDTTTGATEDPDHEYPAHAVYSVTLTVTDSEGSVYTSTFDVKADVAVLDLTQSGPVNEGDTVSFGATYNYPAHTAQTITWDFGDGNSDTTNTLTPSHAYVNDGTYVVTCTIVAENSRETIETVSVTILNLAPTVDVGADITINEGSTATFSATVSDLGSSDTFTYQWSLGRGVTSTELSPSERYADDGVYTITLTVSDGTDSASDSFILTIKNLKPKANAGRSKTGIEGYQINFEGTASDPGSDALTIQWNFGDGQSEIGGRKISHVYFDDDIYTVTMTVTDGDGGTDSDTTTVTINNMSPIVDAGGNLELGYGVNHQFDGSVIDKGNDIDTIEWDFGDDSTAFGSLTPTHNYGNQDATFYGTLTVTDDDGAIGKDKFTVIIGYGQFIIHIPDDIETFEGQLNDFSVSSDFGFPIEEYNWNFGDGTTETSTTRRVSHSYVDQGVYTVTVELVADGGNARKSGTFTVTVLDMPTVIGNINPSPALAYEADSVTFSSFFEDSGVNDITSFTWTIDGVTILTGDPRIDSYSSISHVFPDNGLYEIKFQISGASDSGEATLLFKVNNVAPAVDFTLVSQVDEGVEVQLSATATDPGLDTLVYTWTIDGVEISNAQSLSHTFMDDGIYDVTVSVFDGDDSASVTQTITINDLTPSVDFTLPTAKEGESVTFTSDVTSYPDEIASYYWDFESAGSSSAENPSASFDDNGDYVITLTVIDDDGSEAVVSKTLSVTNKKPTVNLGDDIILSGPRSSTITGTFNDVSDDADWTFIWKVNGNLVASGSESSPGSLSYSHDFQNYGDNTVVLQVTDKDGATGSDSINVYVNTPPTISVTYDSEVYEGDVVTFSVSIYDPDEDDTHLVSWVINSNVLYGTSVSYTFPNDGTYDVVVTVTDNSGASVSKTVTITVLEREEVDPKPIKLNTIDLLEELIIQYDDDDYDDDDYSGNSYNVVYQSEKAIYYIEKSLKSSYWIDDIHLNPAPNKGKKVFHYESEAIHRLETSIDKWDGIAFFDDAVAVFRQVEESLVEADRILALTNLNDALSETPINQDDLKQYNNYIAVSQAKYASALAYYNDGESKHACDMYREAWEHAQKAIDLVASSVLDVRYFAQSQTDTEAPTSVGSYSSFVEIRNWVDGTFNVLTESGESEGSDSVESLEFDDDKGKTPHIIPISGDVYAIAYSGDGDDGFLKTVTIESDGDIGSVIESLEFDNKNGEDPHIIPISGDVYAIAYEGKSGDGFLKTVSVAGNTDYLIDLEVGWSELPDRTNAVLSIYGGSQDSEALRVDYWDGSEWTNLIADLSSGWNNVTISSIYSGPYFNIRFSDLESTDEIKSSWELDTVLLYLHD